MKSYHMTVITVTGAHYRLVPLDKTQYGDFKNALFPSITEHSSHLYHRVITLPLDDGADVAVVTPRSVASMEAHVTDVPEA